MNHLSSSYARTLGAVACALALVAACSSSDPNDGKDFDGVGGSPTSGAGGAGGNTPSSSDPDIIDPSGSGGSGPAPCNATNPDEDNDGDGYTPSQGDCNDCDPNTNPGAIEVRTAPGGTPVDENCNGEVDEAHVACDDALAIDSLDPIDGARAIGLCDTAQVLSAKWVLADGSEPPTATTPLANFHLGHGILDSIGPNVNAQEGSRMLAVSSGAVRSPGNPTQISFQRNFDKGYTSAAPVGFPKESSSCAGVTTGAPHDATGLEIEIKAPSNALSFSFDFNFFTYEWPEFICTTFNDFFIAHMDPKPTNLPDGNISFDNSGNPISVNNAFLDVCDCPGGPPCKAGISDFSAIQKNFACALGKTGVTGTPWETNSSSANPPPPAGWTNGSSGWLRTSAPVEKGQTFKIRLVTYDSDDGYVDSSTLIDNWQWHAEPGKTETVVISPK